MHPGITRIGYLSLPGLGSIPLKKRYFLNQKVLYGDPQYTDNRIS
jgi:hypothetical protein